MKIILFDGECGFCSKSVRFIWHFDKAKKHFFYAPIQSQKGSEILSRFNINEPKLDTFYFVDNENKKIAERSEGALLALSSLGGFWRLVKIFLLVPKIIRDSVYNLIANNRHKLARKNAQCILPEPEFRKQFLDI